MDTYALAVQQLKKAIENAIEKAIANGELPQAETAPFIIETPADRSHGDFATNAAMAGAKAFRMPPFKIAQAITSNLDLEGTMFDRFETAGPGFINFFLGTEFYSAVIREILANLIAGIVYIKFTPCVVACFVKNSGKTVAESTASCVTHVHRTCRVG